jgi:hypothetical protein
LGQGSAIIKIKISGRGVNRQPDGAGLSGQKAVSASDETDAL